MTDEEIYAGLTEIFRDVFDDDAIQLRSDTMASDIGGWDSQTHVAIIVAAEERFGVRFRTAELDDLKNIGELVRLLAAKRSR